MARWFSSSCPLGASEHQAPCRTAPSASKKSLWIGLLVVGALCTGIYFWRLGHWPWDVDELSSLEEMGLLDPQIRQPVLHPESIVVRLPRLVPVWYGVQKFLLRWLPLNEWGTRFLSAVCGVLGVMVLYGWGWHWRGTKFAAGLALLAGGSLLVLWLAQQNRFYTMAFLWLVLAESAIWAKSKHWGWLAAAAGFTLLAVFTHNVAIVLFGLQAGVVILGWLLGGATGACTLRAAISGALASGVYLGHVRPIAGHWTGAGFTWAPPWASFTAHVGVPTLVLAFLGSAVAVFGAKERRQMGVWAGLSLAVLVFVLLEPWLMPVWNPRYSLLWVLPVWVTGALALETVAAALQEWPSSLPGQITNQLSKTSKRLLGDGLLLCCYASAALLLVPKWASHWIDGTRHDYRQAAQWVVQWFEEKSFTGALPLETRLSDSPSFLAGSALEDFAGSNSSDSPAGKGIPILSNPAGEAIPILTNMELQMRYYLPEVFRPRCGYWAPGLPLPEGECVVVLGGNGWEGPLVLPDRTVQWIGLVGRRRFDELSHVVRIYWVGPKLGQQGR